MVTDTQAIILDGKALAQRQQEALGAEIAQKPLARLPKLVVVLVGNDPASQVYVGRKAKMAEKIGMASELIALPVETPQADVLSLIQRLNADETVDGILVQLPVPKHINADVIIEAILPSKDVDGFHPENVGRLASGLTPYALPCTPAGVMRLMEAYNIDLKGKNAVVLGRSNIVGKPVAQLLLQQNATVTICHSQTQHLPQVVQQADVIIAAIGKPEFVTADWVKPGAVVIDVGINRLPDGRLVGDVDFESVKSVAGWITPVPGGVGPMTVAMLMENTWKLFCAKNC